MKIVYIISWIVAFIGLLDLIVFKHPRWGWKFSPSGEPYEPNPYNDTSHYDDNSEIFSQMNELQKEFDCLVKEWFTLGVGPEAQERRYKIIEEEENIIKKREELQKKLETKLK